MLGKRSGRKSERSKIRQVILPVCVFLPHNAMARGSRYMNGLHKRAIDMIQRPEAGLTAQG